MVMCKIILKGLWMAGTPINVSVILAAAEDIMSAINRSLLLKYGGHIELNQTWAVSHL